MSHGKWRKQKIINSDLVNEDKTWLQNAKYISSKTQVNGFAIFFCFLGAVFMTLLTIFTLKGVKFSSNWIYIIPGCFALITFGCLYEILCLKQYTLDKHLLKVKYIVLKFERVFELHEIESFQINKYNLESQHKGSTYNVHKGNQCELRFKGGRTIKFNSFYFKNYYSFSTDVIKAIFLSRSVIDRKHLQKSYNELKLKEQKKQFEKNYIKYWLIFFVLLSGILLYRIIQS